MVCAITKQEYERKHLTRTQDGHYVHTSLYDVAFWIQRRPCTLQEVQQGVLIAKEEQQVIDNIVTMLTKYRVPTGYNKEEALYTMLTWMEEQSIEQYNKVLHCLSIPEHIKLLTQFYAYLVSSYGTLDNVNNVDQGGKERKYYKEKYLEIQRQGTSKNLQRYYYLGENNA